MLAQFSLGMAALLHHSVRTFLKCFLRASGSLILGTQMFHPSPQQVSGASWGLCVLGEIVSALATAVGSPLLQVFAAFPSVYGSMRAIGRMIILKYWRLFRISLKVKQFFKKS
jgi:hypothetical protein